MNQNKIVRIEYDSNIMFLQPVLPVREGDEPREVRGGGPRAQARPPPRR